MVLPHTESAYEEHLKRAALACKPNVEPYEDYGWTVDHGYLVPVQSTRQAWPQYYDAYDILWLHQGL